MPRLCLALLILMAGSLSAQEPGFRRVTAPCDLQFPRDHGDHPGYRTEWWYYTGNLEADDGRRFGFQFTVFRRQLAPGDSPPPPTGAGRSAWRTNQVYLAHAAVSDLDLRRHLHAQAMARGIDLLAGVERGDAGTRIFLQGWEALISAGSHRVSVTAEDFDYRLELVPQKPPVRHGDGGYSRKAASPGQASCYYSFTRLSASGTLRIHGETVQVRGLAWMDQEFSSAYLETGVTGWDWFSLQLDDGSDLMLFGLRHETGNLSPASSGTLVSPDGSFRHLAREDFTLEPGATWKSPATGAVYPIAWRIRLPAADLRLEVAAAFAGQEMQTGDTTGVTYWEGSVTAAGTLGNRAVTGRGYLEMTGRGGKGFEAPL